MPPDFLDPFKSYRVDRSQGRQARRLSPDRALWRDSHTLFEHGNPTSKPPVLFEWLARVAAAGREGAIAAQVEYQFAVYGFSLDTSPGKAASVLLWRQERLPLVTAYLNDDRLVAALRDALHVADLVGRVLQPGAGRPMQILAEGLLSNRLTIANPWTAAGQNQVKAPQRESVARLAKQLAVERRYWSTLELPFRHLLPELPRDMIEDDGIVYYGTTRVLPEWERTLRLQAMRAFDAATFGVEATGRDLLAVADGRQALARWLRHLLPRAVVVDQPNQEEVSYERVPTPAQ